MTRTIVLFRNDLRLHDNVILHTAVEHAKSGHEVVPLFCFDERSMAANDVLDRRPHARSTGQPKMGPFRAKFQMESVNALRQALQGIGSDLLIFYDRPEKVIPDLLSDSGSDVVLASEECTYEEKLVDNAIRNAIRGRAKLQTLWNYTLYHIEDLPFDEDLHDLPNVFTPFRNKVESKCEVRATVPTPGKGSLPLPSGLPQSDPATWDKLPLAPDVKAAGPPDVHPHAVLDFKGGEDVALARLKYYTFESDLLATYFQTRNGMLGGDYSTKFSPWLAHGCISPRLIHHEIRKYESQRTQNKSTYWVIFELIWRDFYRFFAVKHGNHIFFETGITGDHLDWNSDPEVFELWKEGRTGMPLVDANMRELAATGFMSNRGRQNVASYLVLDLGVDWRYGADWFEHLLLDHDVCSNWGNWVAAAGLTGGRVNKFNITKQSKDYDGEGKYIRTWVPELQNVPVSHVHEPWTMPRDMQQSTGIQIGKDYPHPIPVARMARPQSGGGHGHGGGRHKGGRGGSKGGRGRGARPHRQFKRVQ